MILKIKQLRSAKGMTQCELASNLGVSQAVISGWENETILPRTRDLPMLAAVLGVGIGDLFSERPYPDQMEQAVNI